MTSRDPYYFPFEFIHKDQLVPGENYYMKLNDRIIKKFVDRRHNVPVSDLKGTFVRLYKENNSANGKEYAVFKNVFIMNKAYKTGLCTMMLVRYPDGIIANAGEGCDSYSDKSKNRTVNEDREVFLDVGHWRFGIPTEYKLVSKRALQGAVPELPEYMVNEISHFTGSKPRIGGKSKKYRKRVAIKRSKTRRRR
jgi:hypothetical protein